jgi:hypothetical protein
MSFNPQPHLIKLPRKVKDKATGQWTTRQDLYLEVKWRLIWFRKACPHGTISTEALTLDWPQGLAIFRATDTETRKGFEDCVEKAETRAIGRALALLGFGTSVVGEELSEGERRLRQDLGFEAEESLSLRHITAHVRSTTTRPSWRPTRPSSGSRWMPTCRASMPRRTRPRGPNTPATRRGPSSPRILRPPDQHRQEFPDGGPISALGAFRSTGNPLISQGIYPTGSHKEDLSTQGT